MQPMILSIFTQDSDVNSAPESLDLSLELPTFETFDLWREIYEEIDPLTFDISGPFYV